MIRFMFMFAAVLVATEAPSAEDDEAQIRAMLERKYSLQNACDPAYAKNFATDDATEILPNYLEAQPKETPESVAEFEALCAAGGRSENAVTIQSVDILTDKTALVIGNGEIKVSLPDGSIDYEGEYTFSEIFLKTDEGWRVRHLHVSPIIPGLPTVPRRD